MMARMWNLWTLSATIVHVLLHIQLSNCKYIKRDASHMGQFLNGSKPIVYLTVSSVVSSDKKDRLLELNWEDIPKDLMSSNGDIWVHLYDSDPYLNLTNPLVSVRPDNKGFFRTSLRFPQQVFSKTNLRSSCLGFWIGLVSNGQLITSNCLKTRPHWMYESRERMGNLSLLDLVIPGTHNAGSYAPFNPNDDSIFSRYVYSQEENIWNQLVYGIRYLDLRIAYHPKISNSNEKFWITHSSFRTETSLMEVIRQVREFLNATQEIVVMDFHRFVTGFTSRRTARQRHRELVSLLEEALGDLMIPVEYTSWTRMSHLWNTNKRLYVGYADDRTRRESSLLFPAIRQLWGDVDKVDDLKTYLNGKVCEGRNRLTSAMAQLTPKTTGVLFDSYGGLRKMADQVNRHVSKWYRNEWKHCANIIATDFFLGNNIIDVAIEINKNRFLIFE